MSQDRNDRGQFTETVTLADVLGVGADVFDRTADQFEQYDDQTISFVDHMNAVLADEYDVDHVFAFDGDFATLGLTRVPRDTGYVR